MAAWGPKPFQNELANDYILTLVNTNIHPIIIEPPIIIEKKDGSSNKYLKHKLAYYYDRFRAAIELMILFEKNEIYKFASGYYDLAIEKLDIIASDQDWLASWDDEKNIKSQNYMQDISRQRIELINLKKNARL